MTNLKLGHIYKYNDDKIIIIKLGRRCSDGDRKVYFRILESNKSSNKGKNDWGYEGAMNYWYNIEEVK